MSTHTPGPWQVNELYAPEHKCRRPTPYILDAQGRYVAAALNGDPSITDDEHAANARLIAAAPRMLDVVKWAACESQSVCAQPYEGCCMVHIARAILRDVEGN